MLMIIATFFTENEGDFNEDDSIMKNRRSAKLVQFMNGLFDYIDSSRDGEIDSGELTAFVEILGQAISKAMSQLIDMAMDLFTSKGDQSTLYDLAISIILKACTNYDKDIDCGEVDFNVTEENPLAMVPQAAFNIIGLMWSEFAGAPYEELFNASQDEGRFAEMGESIKGLYATFQSIFPKFESKLEACLTILKEKATTSDGDGSSIDVKTCADIFISQAMQRFVELSDTAEMRLFLKEQLSSIIEKSIKEDSDEGNGVPKLMLAALLFVDSTSDLESVFNFVEEDEEQELRRSLLTSVKDVRNLFFMKMREFFQSGPMRQTVISLFTFLSDDDNKVNVIGLANMVQAVKEGCVSKAGIEFCRFFDYDKSGSFDEGDIPRLFESVIIMIGDLGRIALKLMTSMLSLVKPGMTLLMNILRLLGPIKEVGLNDGYTFKKATLLWLGKVINQVSENDEDLLDYLVENNIFSNLMAKRPNLNIINFILQSLDIKPVDGLNNYDSDDDDDDD